MVPNDRNYTAEHEWVMIDGDIARIGITDHAQSELGDIVYVELPAIGDSYACGDSIAVVESVKAASNIYTVVAGEVVEVNEELDNDPAILNAAADDTFIVAVKISEVDEGSLLTAEQYQALIDSEG